MLDVKVGRGVLEERIILEGRSVSESCAIYDRLSTSRGEMWVPNFVVSWHYDQPLKDNSVGIITYSLVYNKLTKRLYHE